MHTPSSLRRAAPATQASFSHAVELIRVGARLRSKAPLPVDGSSGAATAVLPFERAPVPCKASKVIGDLAEAIAKLAKRKAFDKIVIGTHGRSALAGLLMGSVATKVLHLSTGPVMLVK